MTSETVVLVHGLWVNGMEMGWLRRQLEHAGYQTIQFTGSTRTSSAFENAMDLNVLIERATTETVHYIGHSLGGIVIRHLYAHFPRRRPGRIVTLGTPHNGSVAAARLARYVAGQFLLGKSIQHGLLGPLPAWPAGPELGSIAGTLRLGLGLLIPGIPRPNDGTVAIVETRLDGMTDHIEIPVSHTSMLFSRTVVSQVCQFLNTGSFKHA